MLYACVFVCVRRVCDRWIRPVLLALVPAFLFSQCQSIYFVKWPDKTGRDEERDVEVLISHGDEGHVDSGVEVLGDVGGCKVLRS